MSLLSFPAWSFSYLASFSPFFFCGNQYGTHYLVFPIKSIARRSSAILNCIELGRNGFFSAADIFLENIFFHLFLCFIIFHLPRRPTSERLVIWLLLGVRSFPRSRFVVSPLELKSNGALIKRADCDPIHSDSNWHFFFCKPSWWLFPNGRHAD